MSISLQILLCIAAVIVTAKLAATGASRLGLPLVLGELLAGILLGPSVLNVWGMHWLAPAAANAVSVSSIFKILADLGVVLLMFVAGVETDISMMRRTVAPAFWAATGGVILPMVGGYLLSRSFGFSTAEAVFIGTILTATSVTITAQALMNLNQLRSKVGSTILGAAVIDDVLGLIVLSGVIALAPLLAVSGAKTGGVSWNALVVILGRMVACLVTMGLFGPFLTRWALRQATRLHGHHTEVAVALAIAMLLAFDAQWVGGMAAITGAYLAGLFVAMTPNRQKVCEELHPMLNSFFGPIFFVSIGMEADAWHVGGRVSFFRFIVGDRYLWQNSGLRFGRVWLWFFQARFFDCGSRNDSPRRSWLDHCQSGLDGGTRHAGCLYSGGCPRRAYNSDYARSTPLLFSQSS